MLVGRLGPLAIGFALLAPGLALASIYWVQGVAFHADFSGSLGLFGSGASSSEDVGRIALWTGGEAALGVTVLLAPIAIAVAWHLFHAGKRTALRAGSWRPC